MNGAVHSAAGLAAGIGGVFYFGHREDRVVGLPEVIGGAMGGVVGGRLPDQIEPATSSYHRKFAHSAVLTGAGTYAAHEYLRDLRENLSAKALEYERLALESSDWLEQILYTAACWLAQLASGFVTGVVAGYASHILLDSFTPRGVPIFGFSHDC